MLLRDLFESIELENLARVVEGHRRWNALTRAKQRKILLREYQEALADLKDIQDGKPLPLRPARADFFGNVAPYEDELFVQAGLDHTGAEILAQILIGDLRQCLREQYGTEV
jgi:hypothetical protein